MDMTKLLNLLKKLSESHTLRELAEMCDVSHETIRGLLSASSPSEVSISFRTFQKIEKALQK